MAQKSSGKVTLRKGDLVKFSEEKQAYWVRAANARYAVCTKPFNPRRTVLYTVVDLKENVRGTENLIFGAGAETDDECKEMLDRLTTGDTAVSSRNRIQLNIEWQKTGRFIWQN